MCNMNYLFFDTETSGLPNNWNAPWYADLDNYPRLVTLSWILTNEVGDEISRGDYIVKPEEFEISADSTKIHGITTEKALKEGVSLEKVLLAFLKDFQGYPDIVLVAHNMQFDFNVLFSEFARSFPNHNWRGLVKNICTMESLTEWCAFPGPYGFKWPKLQELHFLLFDRTFTNAHNSMADTEALKRCFFEALKYEDAKKALLGCM